MHTLIPSPSQGWGMSNHKRPEVDARLARIEGHVKAVRSMLNEDRTYPEIVHQIAAVRASLDGVIDVIVEDLVEDCVATAKKGKSVSGTVLELQQVVASSR
jgi:CsoR family transcriptional regulator, copper-sensing transcriptional repressor